MLHTNLHICMNLVLYFVLHPSNGSCYILPTWSLQVYIVQSGGFVSLLTSLGNTQESSSATGYSSFNEGTPQ